MKLLAKVLGFFLIVLGVIWLFTMIRPIAVARGLTVAVVPVTQAMLALAVVTLGMLLLIPSQIATALKALVNAYRESRGLPPEPTPLIPPTGETQVATTTITTVTPPPASSPPTQAGPGE